MKTYEHLVNAIVPVADAFAGTVTTDVVNMKNYETAVFVVQKGAGALGTSTLTVEACDDVTPTNTTAIEFYYQEILTGDTHGELKTATTAGFETTAGANQMYKIYVDSSKLASTGYGYVRMKAVEVVDGAVTGGVLCYLKNSKYTEEIQETAIV